MIAKRTYPVAIETPGKGAWYDWLASDEGQRCAADSASGEYLENRLWRAYTAGLKEGAKQMQRHPDNKVGRRVKEK